MQTNKDWDKKDFDEIAKLLKSKYDPLKGKETHKCVELEHLDRNSLLNTTTTEVVKSIKYHFSKSDILFGKLRPYLKKIYFSDLEGVCSSEIWVLRGKQGISNKWLYYLMHLKKFMDAANTSTGSRMPRADWNHVAKTKFSIPSHKEQTRIVTILETWDKAIELLTKKIKLKKRVKKGLMQQLLTGKIRLSGFRDDWKTKKFGDIGKVSMCKRIFKNQTSASGDIPFYKIGTFGKKPDAFISRQIYDEYTQKYSFPKKGEILISASGTIGRTVIYNDEPAYFQDSNIVWLSHNEQCVLNSFLYQLYQEINWQTESGTIARLYNDNFNRVTISIPSLSEQTAIAKVLTTADNEIEALKKKKQLLENQRTFLLNNLITGKIRTPEDMPV